MEPSENEPKFEFSPKFLDHIVEMSKSHQQFASQSIVASVNFHEKLAVLTAGSLALAVSGAGFLHQKPLANVSANHLLFVSLAILVACLWVSLVCSVAHNFLESYALHLDSIANTHRGAAKTVTAMFDEEAFKKLTGNSLEDAKSVKDWATDWINSKAQSTMKRAVSIREIEMPLSVMAISLFSLGYLSVVVYVFVLAWSV